MQMINILRILIAFICMLLTVSAVKAKEINQNAKASVSKSVKNKLDKKEKIFKFIKLVQPKYSAFYIKKIVDAIFKYGTKYKIDPYIIATTAYVESEFNMRSGPCIGIMQVYKPTLKWLNPKKEYNPYTIDGNIALGTKELSLNMPKSLRRGKLANRASNDPNALALMWGKYNGAGSKSKYVDRCFYALRKLALKNIKELKVILEHGQLWQR
jgi:soluble lytic murein transglycosylase-like protein